MQTTNIVDENIKRIGELFPNCLTERLNDEGTSESGYPLWPTQARVVKGHC